jgi:hypothetical protein
MSIAKEIDANSENDVQELIDWLEHLKKSGVNKYVVESDISNYGRIESLKLYYVE